MGDKTKIDWCDATWNPVTGCLHGCEYCYARGIAKRFGGHWDEEALRSRGGNGENHDLKKPMLRHTTGKNRDKSVHSVVAPYPYCFDPTFHRYKLSEPASWEKPRTIFVCSMADLFGEWVPVEWIEEVFGACIAAPQHRYLFLTKNPHRYVRLAMDGMLPDEENFWYGTTTTTPDDSAFFHTGRNTFVSIEPILEAFIEPGNDGTVEKIKWIIVGAETGNRTGRVVPKKEWIEGIAMECEKRRKPIFMKESLRELMGDDFVQEFPWGFRSNG